MREKYRDDDEVISQINIIPLVDISLVLLIIFIVTATHIILPTIKVDLPQTSGTQGSDTSEFMNITVNAEGLVYVDERLVTMKELKAKILQSSKKDPQLAVVVNIDKTVHFQRVVDVLDLFSDAGITRINIRTIRQ